MSTTVTRDQVTGSPSVPLVHDDKELRDEIRDRLRLASPELVKVVFATIKDQATAAAARQAKMDAKATSMLGAVGFSLTVMASAVGLMANSTRLKPTWFLYVLLLFAVGSALFAALYALRALRIRNVKVLDKDEILNLKALSKADDLGGEEAATYYERHIAFRQWMTVESMMKLQKIRADFLDWAQIAYFVFIALVAALALVLAVTNPPNG